MASFNDLWESFSDLDTGYRYSDKNFDYNRSCGNKVCNQPSLEIVYGLGELQQIGILQAVLQ